jgi:hypothetical protein
VNVSESAPKSSTTPASSPAMDAFPGPYPERFFSPPVR